MIDHDNTVKSYSVSPSMLGRGHILMEPDGPVWVGSVLFPHMVSPDPSLEREHVRVSPSARRRLGRWIVYDDQHAQVHTSRWNRRASNTSYRQSTQHADMHSSSAVPRSQDLSARLQPQDGHIPDARTFSPAGKHHPQRHVRIIGHG